MRSLPCDLDIAHVGRLWVWPQPFLPCRLCWKGDWLACIIGAAEAHSNHTVHSLGCCLLKVEGFRAVAHACLSIKQSVLCKVLCRDCLDWCIT